MISQTNILKERILKAIDSKSILLKNSHYSFAKQLNKGTGQELPSANVT
jgi:hypothetical protein